MSWLRREARLLKAAAKARRLERRVHELEAQLLLAGRGSSDLEQGGEGARGRFFEMARTLSPLISVDTPDGSYVLASDDLGVGRSLFVNRGREESETLEKALRILRAQDRPVGRVLLDIGANIGTTTIPALVHGGFDSAIACEPAPGNFRLLELNLVANGLTTRVQAEQVAVSDTVGHATLALSARNSGDHRLTDDPRLLKKRDTVKVSTKTIDSLVDQSGHSPEDLGLIWIDAQGHEARILGGAQRALAAGVGVVCEFAPALLDGSGSLEALTSLLAGLERDVVDLRSDGQAPRAIEEIAAHYSGSGQTTDLLLLP
jgi:FkbM family methyltransferase